MGAKASCLVCVSESTPVYFAYLPLVRPHMEAAASYSCCTHHWGKTDGGSASNFYGFFTGFNFRTGRRVETAANVLDLHKVTKLTKTGHTTLSTATAPP